MRRLLNIPRQWQWAAGVLAAVAAIAVAAVTISDSGAGENTPPRARVLAHPAGPKPKATARTVHKKSHAKHRAAKAKPSGSAASGSQAGLPPPTLIGVGNVPGCVGGSTSGLSILGAYHASVLRVVVQAPYGQNGQALPCVRAARAAGAKVNIAIGYNNLWPTSRVVAYFTHVLASYAPYAWAISIGNEQEVSAGKGASATPAGYAAVWRAVEPVVARLAPRAIRVAGEISPWGFSFLKHAWASGLPGAQVIAVHGYAARFGFSLGHVVAWTHTTHLPLWATEGLMGPQAWSKPDLHAVPLSQLAGVKLANAWVAQ